MGWKLTATKLFCESAQQWVTAIVHRDGRVKCGYHERHLVKGRRATCHSPETCSLLVAYKEDVFQREDKDSL